MSRRQHRARGSGAQARSGVRKRRAELYRNEQRYQMPPELPTYDDVMSTKDGPHLQGTFSNGTMGEMWEAKWCEHCAHAEGTDGQGCPIMGAAYMLADGGVRPREWPAVNQRADLLADYTCTHYLKED